MKASGDRTVSEPDATETASVAVPSLRRVDPRFVLPWLPTTARVVACPAWRDDLPRAGIELVDDGDAPDLVVVAADRVETALEAGAPEILVPASTSTRPLRAAGFDTCTFFVLPGANGPTAIAPVGRRGLARDAMAHRSAGRSRARRLRADLIGRAVERSVPFRRRGFVVAGQPAGPPRIVRQALASSGISIDGLRWWLQLGAGDDLQRGVFHVSTGDGNHLVVKFSRVPTNVAPFDNDARGLKLVEALGPSLARRAPHLLARLDVDGFPVVVESRIDGAPLGVLLRSRVSAGRKLKAVTNVVDWLSAVANASVIGHQALAAERTRLEHEVVNAWTHCGATVDLVSAVSEVPGVLQHNDLGTWNILGDDERWGIVDWEDSRSPGLPLWDLLYFLTDALVAMERPTSTSEAVDASIRLLAGESDRSPLLFRSLLGAAARLSIPVAAIGPVATLAWLHHGRSHELRAGTPGVGAVSATADAPPLGQLAPRWLSDPRLGPTWSALQRTPT